MTREEGTFRSYESRMGSYTERIHSNLLLKEMCILISNYLSCKAGLDVSCALFPPQYNNHDWADKIDWNDAQKCKVDGLYPHTK